jgi:hypothetical protein
MTAPVFQLPRPATLTRQEAEEWSRAVMLGSGFGWTDHFSKKMEDRDIPMRLVLEVLKTGCVFADPNRLLKKCRSDPAAYQNPENPSRNGI